MLRRCWHSGILHHSTLLPSLSRAAARLQLHTSVEEQTTIARRHLAAGQRGQALFTLKRKRLQEQQLDQLDGWLLNVEEMVRQPCTSMPSRLPPAASGLMPPSQFLPSMCSWAMWRRRCSRET